MMWLTLDTSWIVEASLIDLREAQGPAPGVFCKFCWFQALDKGLDVVKVAATDLELDALGTDVAKLATQRRL